MWTRLWRVVIALGYFALEVFGARRYYFWVRVGDGRKSVPSAWYLGTRLRMSPPVGRRRGFRNTPPERLSEVFFLTKDQALEAWGRYEIYVEKRREQLCREIEELQVLAKNYRARAHLVGAYEPFEHFMNLAWNAEQSVGNKSIELHRLGG